MALLDRLETTRTQRESTRDRLTTTSLTRLTAPDTTEKVFPSHARFALEHLNQLTSLPDQIKVLRQTILDLGVRGSGWSRIRKTNRLQIFWTLDH